MPRKKGRLPSPPPPAPPRDDSGSASSNEEEEESAPATQKAPQNPRPPSTAAADADADSSDGGEDESSGSEADDANAYQVREIARSLGKPSESDADDSSSDSPPEPVQKKFKAESSGKKKRQAADSTPSGGGKAKKAKADPPLSAKAPSESEPRKGKKRKEKAAVPDQSPSKPAVRRWTIEDEIKILEALVSHVKANGTQPGPADLIAAVGDSLERKNCTKTEMYEKVRHLRLRHEKEARSSGTLPANEDDLRKFNLSEAVWGETAKEVAAAAPPISQNDAAASSKSNKGQTKKDKKGAATAKEAPTGTLTESDGKGHATKEKKVDRNTKGGLSKKAAATADDSPVNKSKKRGNHKEDLQGTAKETTNTATPNGDTLVRSKSGKSDKEEKDGDAENPGPKEGTAVTQNDDDDNLAETREEKMDIDPNVKKMRRGFDELHNLYPNLTSYVETIQAQHPCGVTLKRAFEFIADDKACALESKIKKQRVVEMKTEIRRADTKKEVTNLFIGLLD